MYAQAAQGEGPPGQADPTKFSGKKSKAVAKQGAGNTQWAILRLSGIPEAEIPSFRCLLWRPQCRLYVCHLCHMPPPCMQQSPCPGPNLEIQAFGTHRSLGQASRQRISLEPACR